MTMQTTSGVISSLLLIALLSSFIIDIVDGGVPAPALFYKDQLIDHTECDLRKPDQRWSQRYYLTTDHFQGPGSPILVIMGGEGAIGPERGFVYPVVLQMAQNFGAIVVQPEHRFYGLSQPISDAEIQKERTAGRPDPRLKLLTPEQALLDAIRLVQLVQEQAQCSPHRNSSHYCPVITIGGSYPGFLSAMARVRFPQVVDMAYAASAPMKFYAQQVDPDAYYDHITKVTGISFPGCPAAVKKVLEEFVNATTEDGTIHGDSIGVCKGSIPDYIQTVDDFIDEVIMMVGYTFANINMAFYPPSPYTALGAACQTFSDKGKSSMARLRAFLVHSLGSDARGCFTMRRQLPTGPNATISSGDWSGVGTGHDGESWDFQTCSLLVEAIGFGKNSMFPARPWSMDWLNQHCQNRFGVRPTPNALVDAWGFDDDDLIVQNASRIIFTNGLRDGWSVSGFQDDLSDTLLAINFPNGAHHSDLSGHFPTKNTDTSDILAGLSQIQHILATWLNDKEIVVDDGVVQEQ